MNTSGQQRGFLGWANRAPEGAAADLKRVYALARVGFPIGLFAHVSYIALFWLADQPVMALVNVISAVFYVWSIWCAWTLRDIKLATILAFLGEIPLHAILATYYMGFEPFFVVYLLFPVVLLPLTPFFSRRWRLGLSLACAVMFVAISALAVATEPVRPLSAAWSVFFLIFNAAPVVSFVGIFAAIYETIATSAEEKMAFEFDRAEGLLLNILPAEIAERLKAGEEPLADHRPSATVLFADIVGFTDLSRKMPASELVALLNDLFSRFDELVARHGAEKIKTIGDAYMAAAGLGESAADHVAKIADLALDMRDAFAAFRTEHGLDLKLRIGVHSGAVVAGVIGKQKFAYDLWGDTVNVASRMESEGLPDEIQISADAWRALSGSHRAEPRGEIEIKGHKPQMTYLLKKSA